MKKYIVLWTLFFVVQLVGCSGVQTSPVLGNIEEDSIGGGANSESTIATVENIPAADLNSSDDEETHIPSVAVEDTDTRPIALENSAASSDKDQQSEEKIYNEYVLPKTSLLESNQELNKLGAVFPIGWSETNFFSYVAVSHQENIGFQFEFIIQNMENSVVVYKIDAENYEVDMREKLLNSLDGMPLRKFAETLWEFYKNRISKALSNRKIVQSDHLSLEPSPFRYLSDEYDFKVQRKELESSDEGNALDDGIIQATTLIKIFMTSRQKGKKVIYLKKYPITVYREILGVIRSPFQEHAAVLVGNPSPNFRAETERDTTYTYDFVGASLVDGFTK